MEVTTERIRKLLLTIVSYTFHFSHLGKISDLILICLENLLSFFRKDA